MHFLLVNRFVIAVQLLLFTFILLPACESSSTKSKLNTQEVDQIEKLNKLDSIEGNEFLLPKNFYKYMEGTIGDISINMYFIKTENDISGFYAYQKVGIPLLIQGEYKQLNMFNFDELSPDYKITGKFEGKFVDENSFEGTWTNSRTNKSLPVNLYAKTDEITAVKSIFIQRKNCDKKTENLKKPKAELEYWDTLCSKIEIHKLEITCVNPKNTRLIEQQITKALCESFGERKKSVDELLALVNPKSSYEDDFGFELEISVNINAIGKEFICLSVHDNSYSYGAAHPNSGSSFINIDLIKSKVIELEDVIDLSKLESFKAIAEKLFVKQFGSEGYDYNPGDFIISRNFELKQDGITLCYNPYEIGSYAVGAPSIFIPFKSLKKVLNPSFNIH